MTTEKTTTTNVPQDKQIRQHSVPAANLREAWPIAHINAYREIAPALVRLHDSLTSASGESMFPTVIQGKIMEVLEEINSRSQHRWEEYVRAAAAHPMEAETLRESGLPEHITYNEAKGIPFLTWLSAQDGPMLNWRQIHINILEDKSGQPFILTPPFRPVSAESLPKGTIRVAITDQVHAATVAVDEVIASGVTDLMRAKSEISPRDNWVRMRMVANFYAAVVEERMKELALDDYKDWVVTLPAKIPLLNAPSVIARHGANAIVIQLLAMRAISDFISDCLDRAEKEPGNATQDLMVDQVIGEMQAYADRIHARATGFNDLLVSESVQNPDDYKQLLINRPVPRGTPFIAMIPKGAETEDGVTPLIPATIQPDPSV